MIVIKIDILYIIMLSSYITKYDINVRGILHIGANYCQEKKEYEKLTSPNKIFWVEANPIIVENIKSTCPEQNIYQALITDKDDEELDFNISSNDGQSSSIYEFNKHKINHPSIHFISTIKVKTTTLDTFCSTIFSSDVPNVLVIDVQGAELLVLSGGDKMLENVDIILTEVNIDYTYTGCGLVSEIDNILSKKSFQKVYQHIWSGHTYGDAIYIKHT